MHIAQAEDGGCIVVSDDGREIYWSLTVFSRTRYTSGDDKFRDINGYWASLPARRRDQIFDTYLEIKTLLDKSGELEDLTLKELSVSVSILVKQLYSYMPFGEVESWMRLYSQVTYPTGLREEHDPDDPNPDRTYLVRDYNGLVVLTAVLRPMVPIWGEYIRLIVKSVGSTYKEYVGMRIIARSYIYDCEPFDRLRRYIECNITKDADTSAAVVSGLSRAEIPEWLLAVIVIRRMSVGDIDANETSGSIITNIYGFVNSTLDDLNKKFGGVKGKYPESGTKDSDEGGSMLESYRTRQPISTGDSMMFNVYAENTTNMVMALDASVPQSLIDECHSSTRNLITTDISKIHVTLVQWILASAISPEAIPGLTKQSLVNAIAACQALLLHWGFGELALLIAARQIIPDARKAILIEAKVKIDSALVDDLNIHYPFILNQEGLSGKRQNPAYTAIIALSKMIVSSYWKCISSESLVRYSKVQLEEQRRIKPSADLANQLATLTLFLQRDQNEPK